MPDVASIPGFTEPFSSLSHFVGALVFVCLSLPLIVRGRGNALRVAGLVIFSVAAVLLLALSGTYHLLSFGGTAREVLRRLDHAAIFVLIAASFTPAHIILFRGWGRWGMLALIWGIAFTAISLKMVFFSQIPQPVGLAMYIGMGWIGVGTTYSLWRRYGIAFVMPIVWGGLAYTAGGLIDYIGGHWAWQAPLPGVVQWHELFHIAVLVGLACHWSFVYHIADGRLRPTTTSRPVRLPAAPAGRIIG